MSNIPITTGSGAASVAAETIGGISFQQIQVYGKGGASVVAVNPDGSTNVSVVGGVNVSGSIIGVVTGSVVAIPTGNQSVSGTVGASIIGTPTVNQFFTVGGNVDAQVQALWGGIGNPPGVANFVLNEASLWDRQRGNSSVGALVSPGIRNDTLSSIYGSDGIAYRAAFGPAGEQIVANAPFTKWVQGTADLRVVQGASVTTIAAQGASIFTYITGVQVANFGPSSVLVTLGGGLGSVLGYTIAPAGGGSNIVYPNALKTGANSAFTASINGTASVLVSAQGFIAKI